MVNQGQGNGNNNNNKEEKNLTDPNQFTSITEWWQQYSPLGWSERYNEHIKYTASMTEIYKEYIINSERRNCLESVKSAEKMIKYWLNKFRNPSYSKEQRRKSKP